MDETSNRVMWTELLDLTLRETGSEILKAKNAGDDISRVLFLDRAILLLRAAMQISFELDQEAATQ